jgi:sulfatase maturation enzyme AslB (radical SAM superfamily)
MEENQTEIPDIPEVTKEEIDAEKEFQFLEDTFNLFLKDEIKKLKLKNINNIKGWLKYNKNTVLKLESGTVINLYLLGENKSILFDRETWQMIRDCISAADKRKMQLSSTLVLRDKALEYKMEFYKEFHKGKIIRFNSKDSVIELLPANRIRVYESANVTVTVVDMTTKLSSSVTLPYEQYQQAKYAASIDLARKVRLLEMEKEA